MNVPIAFLSIEDSSNLETSVSQLGYDGTARFVGFWWQEDQDQLAWADSSGRVALGRANDHRWLILVRPHLFEFDLGSTDQKANQVLIWDRDYNRFWIATHVEGVAFLNGCRKQSIQTTFSRN